ncbi:MAG TPA: hypothetical protein VGH28_14445 [Polyangiaceae bacterium]|jgi:hypothetical protein
MKRLAIAVLCACGYQPLYATPGGEAYHVHLTRNRTASAMVAEEVLRGARETLAKEGALAAGDEGYPRIEIEVLRADETSEGVVAKQTVGGEAPEATASDLAVVARGFVARRAGGATELDTGDLRAEDVAAVPDSATAAIWQREDSLRAVAHRLGGRIALKILGHPVVTAPSD